MILVWRWIFNWNIIGEKTRETKNWCQANVSGILSCENELWEESFENENWEQNVEEPNKAQLVKKDGHQWWLNTLQHFFIFFILVKQFRIGTQF